MKLGVLIKLLECPCEIQHYSSQSLIACNRQDTLRHEQRPTRCETVVYFKRG